MKVRGKNKFDVPRKVVTLVRTLLTDAGENVEQLPIRIRALPVGVERTMVRLFPDPVVPVDFLKNENGVILRDPDTKKVMTGPVNTPQYADAMARQLNLRLAFILFHGIDDPDLQFDGAEGRERDAAFYEDIFKQLVEFGFTMGDLGKLMSEITGLMNAGDDIETAKGN